MDILNNTSLESNKKIKLNFSGGDLSSDAGLLLLKKFICKVDLDKLIKQHFKTNDKKSRFHKDGENLLQKMYQQFLFAFLHDPWICTNSNYFYATVSLLFSIHHGILDYF